MELGMENGTKKGKWKGRGKTNTRRKENIFPFDLNLKTGKESYFSFSSL